MQIWGGFFSTHVHLFCVLYNQKAKKSLGIPFNMTFHYHSLDRHPSSAIFMISVMFVKYFQSLHIFEC